MVCGLFSVFWLSFGMLQLPTLGLAAAYSSDGDAAAGAVSSCLGLRIGYILAVYDQNQRSVCWHLRVRDNRCLGVERSLLGVEQRRV
jgi:hypothetical protein